MNAQDVLILGCHSQQNMEQIYFTGLNNRE